MPLPIEVNHVLGRRSFTLAHRDVDAPVNIGRSRECDVRIPSVTVASIHCMLFVHEGQWLLQESPGAVVTVNSRPIAGPVALQIGDAIGIGPGDNAPTIQIDPAGAAAGRTGPAMESIPADSLVAAAGPAIVGGATNRKIRPPKPTAITGEVPPQLATATPASPSSRPAAPPPLTDRVPPAPLAEYADTAESATHEPVEPDGDTIDFGASAAAGSASIYRPRKKKQSSGATGLVLIFLVVIGGLAILIWWAWERRAAMLAANAPSAPAPVVAPEVPQTEPDVPDGPIGTGRSIFDIPGGKHKHAKPAPPPTPSEAEPSPAPEVSPPEPVPPPAPVATAPAADENTTGDDPAWDDVIDAHASIDQANAISRFENYRENNPGKHFAELAEFDNYAIDRLWWIRIDGLFKQRVKIDEDIAAKKTDLANQPPGDFHKGLEAALAESQQQRETITKKITVDMAYSHPTAPDLDDSKALAELSAQRDRSKFDPWKKNVLVWIREHHGVTPWADE